MNKAAFQVVPMRLVGGGSQPNTQRIKQHLDQTLNHMAETSTRSVTVIVEIIEND